MSYANLNLSMMMKIKQNMLLEIQKKKIKKMNYIGGFEELKIIDDLIESMLEQNIKMSLKEFISTNFLNMELFQEQLHSIYFNHMDFRQN